ncbi:MAG: hypothetical protein ACKVHP_22845 [Verrucomicrobiales bacterium]|jgi:hypothetical protein
MRILLYIILFITPTVLVLVYRQDIQDWLTENGLLGRVEEKSVESTPASPGLVEGAEPRASAKKPTSAPAQENSATPGDLDQQVAAKYPLPNFKSLESIVENWRNVPKRAYPKIITLKKAVDLELLINGKVAGKSTLRVGQQAYPVELKGMTLMISGRPDDATLRGSLPLDETDFKEQVSKTYDDWKRRHEGRIHKLRKEEKQRLLAGGGSAAAKVDAPTGKAADLGKEPQVAPDGTVTVMAKSIRSGEVTEIQIDKIHYWRWIGYEVIGSTGYWTGVIGYTANTIFGEINAEGKALIRNGKVIKWIYSGSEEEIQ